jgi:dTDP-4-amino-4,6-dideoxygalactose transaminase
LTRVLILGANYFSTDKYMDYVALGYNFRMSNITAALGVAQLKNWIKSSR